MDRSTILMCIACERVIALSHQCKTENGIEPDENFKITEVIGDFDLVKIKNQYNQEYTINPNNLRYERNRSLQTGY